MYQKGENDELGDSGDISITVSVTKNKQAQNQFIRIKNNLIRINWTIGQDQMHRTKYVTNWHIVHFHSMD